MGAVSSLHPAAILVRLIINVKLQ